MAVKRGQKFDCAEAEKQLKQQNYFVKGTKTLVSKKNEQTLETFAS